MRARGVALKMATWSPNLTCNPAIVHNMHGLTSAPEPELHPVEFTFPQPMLHVLPPISRDALHADEPVVVGAQDLAPGVSPGRNRVFS
jgi:hypothetical protein